MRSASSYPKAVLNRLIDWVKLHKFGAVVLLILLYIVYRLWASLFGFQPIQMRSVLPTSKVSNPSFGMAADSFGGVTESYAPYAPTFPAPDYAPNAGVANRMVVQNSYLSLLVDNVVDIRKKILGYTADIGGYMVNAQTANPQDAPTATITIRVPAEKLDASLETFRGWGVKVVSENLQGYDVTDQYIDADARIETLEKTKRAMEQLLDQAVQISDLTNLTREVINIQSQIDALKGSQKSLAENAKLAKVTIYLSTDEIALPYAPNDTFRPSVIFKLAVRSLLSHLRQLGSLLIWVAVYAVVWVPVLVVLYLINKRFSK